MCRIFNNFKGLISRSLILSLCLLPALSASAVTQDEMDQARAIAASYYLQFANDGAGYLKDVNPKSMSELEGKLKAKDKENLAAFKKIGLPKDYASWDKDALVQYWSVTFFKENKGSLIEKGAANELRQVQTKKALNAMKVGAPAPKTEEPAKTEEAPAQQEQPAVDTAKLAQEQAIDENLDKVEQEIAEAESMVALEEEQPRDSDTTSSGTWVYIMILAILIAVVIFLVIYASRTMKGQQKQPRRDDDDNDNDADDYDKDEVIEAVPVTSSVIAESTRMREKYAETLAAKSEEIRSLNRQLAEIEGLAASLKEENRRLRAELEQIRNHRYQPPQERPSHHHEAEHRHVAGRERDEREQKVVYLGRVNSRGVFVRADRQPVEGQSVFKLTTKDGLEGEFTFMSSQINDDLALYDPGKWLSGGCVAKDIFDTEGRTEVINENPGTAIFREGAWRVGRKARIRYQ